VKLEGLTPTNTQHDFMSLFRPPPEQIQFVDAAVRRVKLCVTLKAGNRYRVTVTALRWDAGLTVPRVDNYCSIGAGQTEFKAGLCYC